MKKIAALQHVARAHTLKAAWNKISRGKLAKPTAERIGNDGQSLVGFSRRLDGELNVLSRDLNHNKFRFSQLDPFFIPKADGKFRVICVPTVADRVVQRALLDIIASKQAWMKNAVSYGFVSGGGVERAVGQAVKYRKLEPWVFKTDITKFFDNVSRELLKAKVQRQIRQRSVHSLLLDAIDCEIRIEKPSHENRIKKLGIREGRGVRQGMPLSPFFANLFLAEFDRQCVTQKISVLRYADDLMFFASSEERAKELKVFCNSELSKIELEIPELVAGAKSQIYAPNQAAEFLGVEVAPVEGAGYEVRLGQKQLHAIKDKLYSLGDLSELRRRNLDVTRFGNSLAARVAAYSSTYDFCANSDQLDAQLKDWRKATLVRVAQQLGIDVSALTPDGRWFLGID